MKYKSIKSKTNIYFVTSVIAKHKSIFWSDGIAAIALNSLNWFREEGLIKLYAFCLMPNHLHIVLELIGVDAIERMTTSFHKFTGRRIAKYFAEMKDEDNISFFKKAAKNRSDREHMIWEDSITKIIETEHVLLKLIEYIHNNPVNKKWRLVEERADYPYSSACFYDRGLEPMIPIDDVRKLCN